MKQATSSRATSSVEYRQYLSELAERTNELLIRAQLTVQEKLGPDTRLAVILDGLDRVDLPDHQREIFMDYRDLFARMACHAVLTVPIPVACSSERRSLQEAFGQIEMLPCLKVDEDAGMEKAREMVYKRCDSSLFAPGVVDSLCRWSGGDVRNLMRLLRGANSGAAQPPISAADAEAAFWATARDFSSWLQEEHYAVLVSHDLNRSLVPTDDPGPELLQAGAILAYSNHNPWYLVHPAIKELTRFKELRKAETR